MTTDSLFPIVGIVAPDGGLRALEDFFKTIPADPGMAFVIIADFAPGRVGDLPDSLARHTDLAVKLVRDGQKVERNKGYVLPPGSTLTIVDGHMRLNQIEAAFHGRHPADVFFVSLARDRGEYAIGILLSGGGSDGVLGVKAIKEHGGLVLARGRDDSGPDWADMPDNAIATGLADFAIPIGAMARTLAENFRGVSRRGEVTRKPKASDESRVARAELELRDTRERLRGAIAGYEAALEELKSVNGELVSLNKELRARNDELETAQEKLQSLNEGVQAVNTELRAKLDDLDRANGDLTNLFVSTDVATIFLDRNLAIRSFTPAMSQLFDLVAGDKGRPFRELAMKFDYPELQADITAVLASGALMERRTRGPEADAPHFLARLTPYRESGGATDGVVATFIDVTNIAKSEERQRNLVAELNHRVKNMLAVVVAITQQTLARAASPDAFAKAFLARLQAMARSHELLSRQSWGEVGLEEMVRQGLAPYVPTDAARITLSGPAMTLPPTVALSLGMVIAELATNAVNHGALSNANGRVGLAWSSSGDADTSALTLVWREVGGPAVTRPQKIGFGLKVVKREIEYGHFGAAQFEFDENGFSARLQIPLTSRGERQP